MLFGSKINDILYLYTVKIIKTLNIDLTDICDIILISWWKGERTYT